MSDAKETAPTKPVVSQANPTTLPISNPWYVVGLVLVCFVASFLGAWLFTASGLVKPTINTSNQRQIVAQEGEVIADIFNNVSPSTVAITTKSVTTSSNRLFPSQVTEGAGSGVVISKDGYIMTNKHVVPEGTSALTVVTSDGKEYTKVKVIGRDPFNDIAFIKIEGVNNLKPATLGDSSKVAPGQKVVAIGNALGQFRNSITSGIISGIGRPIQAQDGAGASEQLENLLQTDAAINPGNSGGPLVNLSGEVIGINTAIAEQGQAIGFAIPINDAKNLVNSVIQKGKIVKPYLGVQYIMLDADSAAQYGVKETDGALVIGNSSVPAVLPGSPAAKAGLRSGDVIKKVDSQDADDAHSLSSLLAQHAPGDKVEIVVSRDGNEQKITVVLEEYTQ